MAADPRRIVSSMVEAKACHVTNLAECSRRYGLMIQQDEEGSRHRYPCGSDQKCDN